MLRGFFIFVVFIFKSSVWQMIKKKYPRLSSCLGLLCLCNSSQSSTSASRSNDNDNVELMRLDNTRQATSECATKHQVLTHHCTDEERIEVMATSV